MMRWILLLILTCGTWANAQDLPASYVYQREFDSQTKQPIYSLTLRAESFLRDAEQGTSFESIGAVVQPDRNFYSLVLMIAKPQLKPLASNQTCSLTIDGKESRHKFVAGEKEIVGKLQIETLAFEIDKQIFERLAVTADAQAQCAGVKYYLDADNLDALEFLTGQIELMSKSKWFD